MREGLLFSPATVHDGSDRRTGIRAWQRNTAWDSLILLVVFRAMISEL